MRETTHHLSLSAQRKKSAKKNLEEGAKKIN
jgi:hypothetical protein